MQYISCGKLGQWFRNVVRCGAKRSVSVFAWIGLAQGALGGINRSSLPIHIGSGAPYRSNKVKVSGAFKSGVGTRYFETGILETIRHVRGF